ncbi:FAD-binding oxidoreductase [Thermomicrobiaceae bacterium CFH 74404]|uniref:FAD-binding oxidoreductase n=1 Tax=Thermalbibacter longus TaxID=2951981 RepID=A0AA41WH13_9BACT|nr:FAD-dependent oxidoreductase [Thermalbibacter longus]MCM8749953.1 FAD-binding oxidoreductase [Thermalbibacter longus]
MRSADVVVIGAGVAGASVAYHLKELDANLHVVLLEAQESPGAGETSKATGGIRLQFGTEANIRLSQLSLPYFEQFLERFGVDPGFRQHGYLFVTTSPEHWETLQRQAELQRQCGVPTQLLVPDEIAELHPALRVDDLIGGAYCPLDGSLDPYTVVQGFLARFRELGGEVVTESLVTGLSAMDGSAWRVQTPEQTWTAQTVVLAAGPWTRQVAAYAGIDLPVFPYQRQVFVVERPPSVPSSVPLTVDVDTGWYAHTHGYEVLLGGTDKDDRPGLEATVDWDRFARIHEATARRMPVLVEAKVVRAYAGARSLTPDHHPILGPVEDKEGLYVACGFSGHGVMHSPAVGLLVAEWIVHGAPVTWDASALTATRFRSDLRLTESVIF